MALRLTTDDLRELRAALADAESYRSALADSFDVDSVGELTQSLKEWKTEAEARVITAGRLRAKVTRELCRREAKRK